ncbi:MAG: class I SAM-dependent methyltransferase [Candidatus Eisenbacteria bacterium]
MRTSRSVAKASRPLAVVEVVFSSRESRSRFVHARFGAYLKGSVLDLGCFEAPLRSLIGGARYVGVDFAGDPDVALDLEKTDRLPFDDSAFDCVLCIDVLEHLDNFHAIFDELVRVSRRHVVVSLPNCWCNARRLIGRGKGYFCHYGLPLQRPEDRHKWFFNLSDAQRFLEGQAGGRGLDIREMFYSEKPKPGLLKLLRRILYPGERYRNRYGNALWAVLEKRTREAAPAPRILDRDRSIGCGPG